MGRIVVLTNGLWKLRREIACLTGMEVARWSWLSRPDFDAVAGWGHARTAEAARRLAEKTRRPYLAFEDGLIRSVKPGPSQPPMSMVVDRSGIFYAADRPSDLLGLMSESDWFTADMSDRAQAGIETLKRLRLSKYNSGPERTVEELGMDPNARRRVLVIDQVQNDASVRGAGAGAEDFRAMLTAAEVENPDAEVVVKLHPDALSGRRVGYFSELRPSGRIKIVAQPINPWSLIEASDAIYTVSSGLGFEAALAGKSVSTFGYPFYAGWGFTDDRKPASARPRPAGVAELFAAFYFRYSRYFDAYSRHVIEFEEAIEQLAWLRDRYLAQTTRAVCYRIAPWKRPVINVMLDSPAGRPVHVRRASRAAALAKSSSSYVATWASRDPGELQETCRAAGVPLVRIEDGFIRSAGLGASFVPPSSLVFDRSGIYYDGGTPSDLETILNTADIPPELIARAARLRAMLVTLGTTKYNVTSNFEADFDSGGRTVVLVPGQVEDDASIRQGSPRIQTNLDLLKSVRARNLESFIIYKPHPDVEAGLRKGRVPPDAAAELADLIVANGSILDLVQKSDRVETMTSLAGFEALLRGREVAAHGQPFYAGWGLTEDLCPIQRRTRLRSLDELVAAALILYPRYIDPLSKLPCEPELLVQRLASSKRLSADALEQTLGVLRMNLGRALYWSRSVKSRLRRI